MQECKSFFSIVGPSICISVLIIEQVAILLIINVFYFLLKWLSKGDLKERLQIGFSVDMTCRFYDLNIIMRAVVVTFEM